MANEFWTAVNEARATIRADISKTGHELQPRNGTVFLMSLQNRVQRTVAGSVCEATIALAGQRVAEGSHRLATNEEISAHLKQQEAARENLTRLELQRKQTFVFDGIRKKDEAAL